MPKQIQKSLQECLSKLKISNKQILLPLGSSKHAKTASSGGKANQNDGVTLSDMDRFFMLYQEECGEGISRKKMAPFLLDSPRLVHPPPENLCRSARFFVESGSSSSRITDGPLSSSSFASAANDSSASENTEAGALAAEDFVALLTYSPRPYDDFRQSMQEMVEMRLEHKGKVDWTFLEELLFCYLDYNSKKSYTYILQAFVDVIAVLRESSVNSPAVPAAITRRSSE